MLCAATRLAGWMALPHLAALKHYSWMYYRASSGVASSASCTSNLGMSPTSALAAANTSAHLGWLHAEDAHGRPGP